MTVLATMPLAGCPCRKEPPAPPPEPPPIHRLCVEASPQLNFHRDSAHTLLLRLFQLSSTDAFDTLEPQQLLEPRTPVAGQKGTVVERTIYPGKSVTLDVDVEPGARFLGVVAGYYRADGPAKASRPLVRNLPPEGGGAKDDEDEDEPAAKKAGAKAEQGGSPCLRLGANGIEGF